MSKVQVSIVRIVPNGVPSAPLPSCDRPVTAQMVTSGGTSAPVGGTSLTPADIPGVNANVLGHYAWRIAVSGTDDVHVTWGSSPTATDTNGFLCPAGGVYEFRISSLTDKVAVINA